jgi:hypothetical protein
MPKFKKSTRKNNKYMVDYGGTWIHFGNKNYQQFKDRTGLGLYSHLDHGDEKRRKSYLARAKGIKNKNGNLTWNNPQYANYYSVRYLW